MRNTIATLLAVGATSILAIGGALAGTSCDAQVAALNTEVDAKVQPALTEIDDGIAEVRKAGGDPTSIAFKMPDGSFKTLPDIRDLVLAQKAAATSKVSDAAAKCVKDLKPYQDTTDALITYSTGGLNKLLPERMMHVDIGEILVAGKPLGGGGALIPHFREQLFASVGLSNDRGEVTKFIRDPLHSITKIFH